MYIMSTSLEISLTIAPFLLRNVYKNGSDILSDPQTALYIVFHYVKFLSFAFAALGDANDVPLI